MRLRVIDFLQMLGSGMSEGDILEEFPDLAAEDVRGALQLQQRAWTMPFSKLAVGRVLSG